MQEERHATQVNDNLELLELMMRDREFAPIVYKPNNRWLSNIFLIVIGLLTMKWMAWFWLLTFV